jgi:DNA-binding XRE family transcriptional regulator
MPLPPPVTTATLPLVLKTETEVRMEPSRDENGQIAGLGDLTRIGKMREARHQRGPTLQQLAQNVSLSASHISQIERGITSPRVRC